MSQYEDSDVEWNAGERVAVSLLCEDAIALVLGPLDYTTQTADGRVPGGGSPLRARREIASALGYNVEERQTAVELPPVDSIWLGDVD